ncbi:MAG: hypothetical protein I8H66_05410 [Sphingobacteriia bacterium]|nr:hypothetical protein [Sphingobacteriia bacterium]
MSSSKQKLDIIDKILDACYRYNPDALFVMSLMHQYEERGSLSKKQLEGLYQKALKVPDMPVNWLATLQATINKMHTREKAPAVNSSPLFKKDEVAGEKMAAILQRYPQHKRVIFLFSKYQQNELLTLAESAEVDKFYKLLMNR